MHRRSVLKLGLGASALALLTSACSSDTPGADGWNAGDLQHILPLVSHRAFNIKLSFRRPQKSPPILLVGLRTVTGQQQDSNGRFWSYRVDRLSPNTQYNLQLQNVSGQALCDDWPLKTFPAPKDQPEQLKIISYTCAGGPDLPVLPGNRDGFKPAAYRAKLLQLMLEKRPDLVVANGDHIYWDYRSWEANRDGVLGKMAAKLFLKAWAGTFTENQAVIGTTNEDVLTSVGDEQIAKIYGVTFRSTPVFFITDDHDYFENDDATPELVTFPPRSFNQDLRDSLQRLYFPEYIVEESLDGHFPGQIEAQGIKLSTHFGQVRYGELFAGLLYDCGGQLSIQGDKSGLVPPVVESWLIENTQREDSRHLVHFPSHPVGWTAGKWREWYPDVLESTGTLLAPIERDEHGNKFMWQRGWWLQHQRLLKALSAQKKRRAMVVSGDLHLLGAGRIDRSAELDLTTNPIHTVLSGPVGIGMLGWLSNARGLAAQAPANVTIEQTMPPVEQNGFTVLNFSRSACAVELYACPEGYVPPKNLTLNKVHSFQLS
jgi:hypothetical protein